MEQMTLQSENKLQAEINSGLAQQITNVQSKVDKIRDEMNLDFVTLHKLQNERLQKEYSTRSAIAIRRMNDADQAEDGCVIL